MPREKIIYEVCNRPLGANCQFCDLRDLKEVYAHLAYLLSKSETITVTITKKKKTP